MWWMRALAACVARLPWAWMRALGGVLGAVAGGVLRIRRAHVERSMRAARVGASAPAVYASLGTGLCELLWLAGRPTGAIDDCYRLAPGAAERFDAALSRGRGLVVATAHVGNWDLAACATARWLSRRGARARLHVITKHLSWQTLDRYWQALRADRGVLLAGARGAWTVARQALGAGDAVVLLVDQVPERSSGVAVFPFLGTPARHDLAAATLAARTGAPIAVAVSHRTASGVHELDVVEVCDAPSTQRASIVDTSQRISRAVETFVRAHPEQWLWLHRRWKGAGPATEPESGPGICTERTERRHGAHGEILENPPCPP